MDNASLENSLLGIGARGAPGTGIGLRRNHQTGGDCQSPATGERERGSQWEQCGWSAGEGVQERTPIQGRGKSPSPVVCYPRTGEATLVASGRGCPCRSWRSYALRCIEEEKSGLVSRPSRCRFLQTCSYDLQVDFEPVACKAPS